MNRLKRFFVLPYLAACVAAAGHSAVMLVITEGPRLGWLGALLAVAPMPMFMFWLATSGAARTSRYMPLQLASAMVGALLVAIDLEFLPTLYALGLGLGGVMAYVFWYSGLGRDHNEALREGATLPGFVLTDAGGEPVNSDDFRGHKTLLLFYRGNWCPLCVAQIKEVAERYRQLAERGVEVILVSPQDQNHTRSIADRFDVPMRFMTDPNLEAARALGIVHEQGVPAGIGGYAADTVYPTVLIVDEAGTIIFSDQTDNYRVRPEPETFLRVLDGEPLLST